MPPNLVEGIQVLGLLAAARFRTGYLPGTGLPRRGDITWLVRFARHVGRLLRLITFGRVEGADRRKPNPYQKLPVLENARARATPRVGASVKTGTAAAVD
jgi:hypothetical protein